MKEVCSLWTLCHPDVFFFSSALLDDLDKELNNYIMRCREWYGWHFPELGKIVTDNLAYCKSVRFIGEDLFRIYKGLVAFPGFLSRQNYYIYYILCL